MRTNAFISTVVATVLAAGSALAIAQNATPPARETPRPQDIDPKVNTSATPPASEAQPSGARETPRPQDVEPRVNTSAPSESSGSTPSSAESGAAAGAAEGAAADAAAPGATSSSSPRAASKGTRSASPQTANANGAAGAAKPGAKGKALDRLELDTTQITGNRELPKVLYIVPWKRSDLGDLVGKPINSLLDEVLTPVDRDVFQRENRYYRALTPGAAENDALSAPDSSPPTPVRNPVPTNSAPAAGSPGSANQPTNASANRDSTGSGSAAPATRDEK
jgi:hypothetical protein